MMESRGVVASEGRDWVERSRRELSGVMEISCALIFFSPDWRELICEHFTVLWIITQNKLHQAPKSLKGKEMQNIVERNKRVYWTQDYTREIPNPDKEGLEVSDPGAQSWKLSKS